MAELILVPTRVGTEGTTSTSHAPYIVATDVIGSTTTGTSALAWVDGLDTTYVKSDATRSSKGTYPLWSDVDGSIPATSITAIGVRFRAMTPSTDPVTAFVAQLFGQVSKLLSNPFDGGESPLTFTASNTWQDFDYIVTDAAYDETGWAPDGVQSALTQTFIYARTVATDAAGEFLGSGVVYTSEQRIVLYYPDAPTDVPPLRLTNRDDVWASASSLTRGDRSQQGGNRLTGYI